MAATSAAVTRAKPISDLELKSFIRKAFKNQPIARRRYRSEPRARSLVRKAPYSNPMLTQQPPSEIRNGERVIIISREIGAWESQWQLSIDVSNSSLGEAGKSALLCYVRRKPKSRWQFFSAGLSRSGPTIPGRPDSHDGVRGLTPEERQLYPRHSSGAFPEMKVTGSAPGVRL